MRAYLSNLSPRTWVWVTVPLVVVAYPLFTLVLPLVFRAVLPEVVRNFLSLL